MNHLCELFGFILVINLVLAEINHGAKQTSASNFSVITATTTKSTLKKPTNINYEFGSDDSEKYFIKYPPPDAEKLTQIPKPLYDEYQNESPSPKDYVTAALQNNHRHKKEATTKGATSFVEYTTLGTVRPMLAKNTSGQSKMVANTTFGTKIVKPLQKISEKRHAEYFSYDPAFKDSYYTGSEASNYFSTQDAEHYPYETSVYQFTDENETTPSKYVEIKGKYEHKYPKAQDLPYYQSEEYLSKLKNSKQYHTTTEKPSMVIHMKPKELGKHSPHFYKPEELHEHHHYPGKEYHHFETESNKLVEPNFNKPHQHSIHHDPNHFPHFETSRPSDSNNRPTHPPDHYEFKPQPTLTYSSKPDSSHHSSPFVVNQEGAFHQAKPSPSSHFEPSYTHGSRPYLKETRDHTHTDLFVPPKDTDHHEYHFEPVKHKPKPKPQEPPNYPNLYHENSIKSEAYLRPVKDPVTPEPEEETTIYVKVKNKNPEHQNRKPTERPFPLTTTVDSIAINPSYYYKPKLCDAFADYELVRKGHGYEAQKKSKRESKKATKKSETIYEQNEADDKQFFVMPEPPQALVQQGPYPGDMNTEDSKNHKFVVVYHHEQKDKQKKRPHKPEHQKLVHTHTHYHKEQEKDYEETHDHEHITHNYPTEYVEEQQPEIVFHYEGDQSPMGSNSIKVVDPSGRSSQVEVTKDDYMRHIKLAAMKYLKEMEDSFGGKSTYYRQEAPIQDINNIQFGRQNLGDNFFQSSKRIPIAVSTPASFRAPFPQPTEFNLAASAKVPKNTFSAGKPLKNAISGLQTQLGQNANPIYRPMGLDIGQNLASAFDHSAVLRNVQGFDMSNVVNTPQFSPTPKPRLHFNKQTYHDINSLMNKDLQQQPAFQINDKGYNSYLEPQPSSFTSIQGNSANVGASISFGQKINQNKAYGEHESIEGPIQIINGLPITNPYNIDVKTLRYMLGGLAQAEVDDHLKEYNHGTIKVKPKLQGHTPLQQFSANSPILAAMEQSLNTLKNANANKNFNNHDVNGFANIPKFNGNGKNRNVRDSMDNNLDYNEDLTNWSSNKLNKSPNNKSNDGAANVITNVGKTSAKSIAKDLIANASNLAPGQYIVRPVKKPQPKNSLFPFIFNRRSEEILTELRPPPRNQRSDEAVATVAATT